MPEESREDGTIDYEFTELMLLNAVEISHAFNDSDSEDEGEG